jgi:hypothetical protein
LGWVKITHPFHPYYGKHFKVLKTRKLPVKDIFILQGSARVTFSVDREWTDKDSEYLNPSPSILSIQKLLELTELLDRIDHKPKKGVDK